MSDNKKSWFDQTQEEIGQQDSPFPNLSNLAINDSNKAKANTTPAPSNNPNVIRYEGSSTKDNLLSKDVQFDNLGLQEDILEGVYAKGYETPSVIQAIALPILLKEQVNLIAQSQSGTGKTATFGLGILNAIKRDLGFPQALVVCPTLELAMQIYDNIKDLAKLTKPPISIATAVKGTDGLEEIKDHVIIGTPGKLIELLKKRKINNKFIRMFVVDEADQMLEESASSLRNDTIKIKSMLPKEARVVLFSATFNEGDSDKEGADKDKAILDFAAKIVPQPYKSILVPKEKLTLEQMKQYYVEVNGEDDKMNIFKEIYAQITMGQSIVFVNYKNKADKIHSFLSSADGGKFPVSVLHGGLDVQQRKDTISLFKNAKTKVLITTNVLSRGIDISQVTHVINYDLPEEHDTKEPDYATYLHRIGRTARFGRKGIAVNFIAGPKDAQNMKKIINYFKTNVEKVERSDIANKLKL